MITIDLTGKTAVVTGAGQGLGAATAKLIHQAGANVVVNYFDDAQGINQQLASKLVDSLGQRAVALDGDVRDSQAVCNMIDQVIDRFGKLDIVVNNAGIVRDSTLKNMSTEQWQSVIDTNLTGVFNVCKAATACMVDGGCIVNVASVSAAVGQFGQANYVAAKAGVMGMTRVLSRELARRGITVNSVAPGLIETDMSDTMPDNVRQQMIEQIPLGQIASPRQIANVILFLCSDLASYITGQTLHVNGGLWLT